MSKVQPVDLPGNSVGGVGSSDSDINMEVDDSDGRASEQVVGDDGDDTSLDSDSDSDEEVSMFEA